MVQYKKGYCGHIPHLTVYIVVCVATVKIFMLLTMRTGMCLIILAAKQQRLLQENPLKSLQGINNYYVLALPITCLMGSILHIR